MCTLMYTQGLSTYLHASYVARIYSDVLHRFSSHPHCFLIRKIKILHTRNKKYCIRKTGEEQLMTPAVSYLT